MPAVSSFDVTSTVDLQEVDNAVNQARKEISQRYDFKGSTARSTSTRLRPLTLRRKQPEINALCDVLQTRLIAGMFCQEPEAREHRNAAARRCGASSRCRR